MADGRIITLVNAAANAMTIQNNDTADSTAANVIITGTGGAPSVPAGASVMVVYDAGASVWRVSSGVAAAGGYIQNQNAASQTANFWISGTGTANLLQAATVDAATATSTLNIGKTSGGNANAIALNQNTTVRNGQHFDGDERPDYP